MRIRKSIMLAIVAAAIATPALSAQLPADQERLSEAQLSELRGGFDLPGGGTITLGVTTNTSIDGREVLRSTYNIGREASQTTVLARSANGGDALSPIDADVDGAGVATRDGIVRLRSSGDGVRVELAGGATDITHLMGRALGSVISNSANDRSIDVTTSVDIGLGGISPNAIGGVAARIDTMALDVTSRLNTR